MISIVTISMNQGRFLPAAVGSVLSQRDGDLEYVVVDAGSSDGSRQYLSSLTDPRIRLIFEPDEGPADGLNKGVRSTTGAVVGYLNADDLYLAGALQEADVWLRENSSVDVVYGDGWIIAGDDQVVRHFESTPWGLRGYLLGSVSLMQQATFLRRESFDRTPGFNERNLTCWDGELLVDLALAGARFGHVRADWAAFRLHAAGISGSGRLEARYQEDRQRYVERALRRDLSPIDRILAVPARGAKLLTSPGYTFRRLRARTAAGSRIDRGPNGYIVRGNGDLG